ncbi:Rieske (2Fe-2S) protein [Streptomyces sp. NPDC046374]|uniref:aromatic ring-hydroxylating oxygenase subunit alpha n=1 Tax=Streptomyces sp. NPDC046374 TaxID=3154917 RepID=UPI0033E76B4C
MSLPPAAFTSPGLWERERESVFGRSWVPVAHVDEPAEPGAYVALSVAGETVVVVRGEDGVLRGLSTVCRHRLMPVVEEGSGRTDVFTCPYHLWRYGLDGRLVGATHMKRNPAFDPRACRLPRFAVAEWRGFAFVNLNASAEPLVPQLRRIHDTSPPRNPASPSSTEAWPTPCHARTGAIPGRCDRARRASPGRRSAPGGR